MSEFPEKESEITQTSESEALAEAEALADVEASAELEALARIEGLQQAANQLLQAMDKKVHNEFAGVIARQQAELDMFREGLGRNAVVGLLKTVATLYGDFKKFSESEDLETMRAGFSALLDEMLQTLFENGVLEHSSVLGEKYSPRYSKPVEKVKTGDKSLHGTVIESRNAGFYADKTVLVPERVKIHVYDEALRETEAN